MCPDCVDYTMEVYKTNWMSMIRNINEVECVERGLKFLKFCSNRFWMLQ